ncbi:hypothetical protein OSG_eHP16_00015 [environmental Halophage eHP-16]|nr:hypothetical protein OSG_eHP16_00015 [environmental Halophage eHP-16]
MSVFGTGVRLTSTFDVGESNGSLETVDGRAVIERDVAFALAREAEVQRGEIPDADFAAEIEILTRRVLSRDPRIATVDSVAVDLDAGTRVADVSVSVTTADGDITALLFNTDI